MCAWSQEGREIDVDGPRILIAGGGLDSTNQGINAITLGTIACIQKTYPNASITVLGINAPAWLETTTKVTLDDGWLAVTAVRTSNRDALMGFLRTLIPRAWAQSRLLECFQGVDAVVDVSEGDGFGETYGLKVLLRHSWAKVLALRTRKPLLLFPQTLGPFHSLIGKSWGSYVLRRTKIICVREVLSEEIAKSLVGNQTAVFCLADMAFLMKPADVEWDLPLSKPTIGINVSGLLFGGRRQIRHRSGEVLDYAAFIETLVRRLVAETRCSILLVPHVYAADSARDDLAACKQIHTRLADLQEKVWPLTKSWSAQEIKGLVGQCEFFVGSRMHSCIAALSQGVPTVPVSYSHKFAGVMEQFSLANWVADPTEETGEQMIEHVLAGFQHRKEIKAQIISHLPKIKDDAMRAGQFLKSVVD
jgi:colanic acid/amylovoran biosynthesis protein